ncbi:MAG: hypothetical protein DME40_01750 [Verrucomicrobia bacterium]|nr:MAG: hypothetical protein DME40_01750 [Verrucomicrobiota bacterium]
MGWAKQLAMERAKRVATRTKIRLGGKGVIPTKTMVFMAHISTVHAIAFLGDPAAFPSGCLELVTA